MRKARSWAALAAVAVVSGCGTGPYPVSGVITLDGKPLPGAYVTFLPTTKAGTEIGSSYGRTGPDGRYTLTTVQKDRPGVGQGEHKVTVSLPRPVTGKGDADQEESLPARYNTKTELIFIVPPSGTDKADFDLKK